MHNIKYRITILFLGFLALAFIITSCDKTNNRDSAFNEAKNPKIEKLKLQTGFKAEHLYSPGDEQQGSWVAMTFDDKDRLITADQYGALYRLTIPTIGSENLDPEIEKLKIQTGEKVADSVIQMGFAQGLLWAFNSLYVVVNHTSDKDFEKSTGLYRLQDTDNNDTFDKITLLKALSGEPGEHGPHSIVLSPDGESLYLIAGNHTDLPKMDKYRLPEVWQYDNLFPEIKDPRGHANNRKAPGGWIAKIDPEGKSWELISAGYRNPFDLAFNELGDMFTYDSDMEWDLGMPWYRPTRIAHVTSGSEFGWRTGDGKWSPAYPDNLPGILNIGQGSPTNVIYGANAKFPAKYRHSLFAFDWSFGIIYTITLTPQGSSYSAEKEEFLSGIPLPLTDGVFGPDGALYFLTGGRKLESDLYRVYYDGDQTNESVTDNAPEETPEHKVRKRLETFHSEPKAEAIKTAWPYLNSEDRYIQYAARIAVEHQPLSLWQEKAYTEKDAVTKIQGMIALARHTDASQRDRILSTLLGLNYDDLDAIQQVNLLRAIELTLSRLGLPGSIQKSKVITYLSPLYPAKTDVSNQLLSKILAFLNDPKVIAKTLDLLESNEGENVDVMANTATNSSDLILRNPQYGMDIAQTLKNMPPAQHTYYGIVLSNVTNGWTTELREKYFKWFYKAFSFKAGRSYIGYIDKARQMALSHVPKDKFEYYNKISGDSLLSSSGNDLMDVAQPEGPGKNWEEEDIAPLLKGGLGKRDFENGKNMFAATACITCHTMNGTGQNIGPDLTQLGTRFTQEDILKAIINPSEVISDQYNSTTFSLKDGEVIVGRVMNEDDEKYIISQNPYAPEITRDIPKDQVIKTTFSTVSLMPSGTINRLNAEELKDLIAYLISGGNENNAVYTNEKNATE